MFCVFSWMTACETNQTRDLKIPAMRLFRSGTFVPSEGVARDLAPDLTQSLTTVHILHFCCYLLLFSFRFSLSFFCYRLCCSSVSNYITHRSFFAAPFFSYSLRCADFIHFSFFFFSEPLSCSRVRHCVTQILHLFHAPYSQPLLSENKNTSVNILRAWI